MIIVSFIFTWVMVILAMSFFTLLERKVLGYLQTRKGPNKVSLMGLFQPFSDAIKLFSKESILPMMSNKIMFLMSSIMMFVFSLLLWGLYVMISPMFYMELGIIYFLCISSLSVYTTMMAGWSSNSKYAFLGGFRAVAQTISYEISSSFIILGVIIFFFNFNFFIMYSNSSMSVSFFLLPIFILWMITMLAETNRTPFDFVEGESELVSGFNIEYSSELFVLLFMAEYMNILFVGVMTSVLFFPKFFLFKIFSLDLYFFSFILSYFFIHIRGSLPRMRYDCLMYFCWKVSLPLSLSVLIFVLPIVIFNYLMI